MKLYNTKNKILQPIAMLAIVLGVAFGCDEGSNSIDFRETTFKPTANSRITTAGNLITFIDSSKAVVSRMWTFDGASISSSDQQQVTVTYPDPGTYPVDIEVTDDSGEINERRFNVKIWNPVVANFSPDQTTAMFGSTINFINLSSSLDHAGADMDFDKFEWTFEGGEPSTSIAEEPSVFYANVGKFNVTLKAVRSFPPDSMSITMEDLINIVDVPVINPVSSKLSKVGKEIHLIYATAVELLDANDKDNFTVTVNGQEYSLTSAELDPADATKIILTLDNNVLEGDIDIAVNYDGDLAAADGSAVLGGISGLPIENNIINLFGTRDGVDYGDFENDAIGGFPAGWGAWNGTPNTDDYELVNTESNSGSQSVQVNLFNDVGFEGWGIEAKGWTTADGMMPNGKYQIQVWAKSTIAGKRLTIGALANGWAQADVGNVFLTTEWALYTYDFEVVDALPRYYYQQLRATEDYTVWIDDVKLYRAD